MYAQFGLPDINRDWENYFEGENLQTSNLSQKLCTNLSFRDGIEIDTGEGNEEMILIQDPVSEMDLFEDLACGNISLVTQVENNDFPKIFSIRSKKFLSGKYVIEENENGFFLCNVKNNLKTFLIKKRTFPNGVINIKKVDKKSMFVICKKTCFKNVSNIKDIIIGYVRKEGLLVKFTSFDRTIVNQNVTI